MKRIMVTVGTRPEAIKMALLVKVLRAHPDLEVILVSTAQHRQMLDQALTLFGLTPDVDLDIMRHDQSLTESTALALQGMATTLAATRPDLLLVQGDTNTVLAGALAAYHHRIPVGHVEAGLRTNDPYLPFPEEMNRRLTSQLATLHFAPTERAARNLLAEGHPGGNVFVTGNTVIDALLWTAEHYPDELPDVARATLQREHRFILVTAHRRESLERHLRQIALALKEIVETHPDVEIIYPVHLNPRVQQTVNEVLTGVDKVHLIAPVSYAQIVQLIRRCHLVLTDSGGIQEEAPAFGKPVLVMRQVTERPEAVEAGVARIVGVERQAIVESASRLLRSEQEYARHARVVNPFGDGTACRRISEHIGAFLRLGG